MKKYTERSKMCVIKTAINFLFILYYGLKRELTTDKFN